MASQRHSEFGRSRRSSRGRAVHLLEVSTQPAVTATECLGHARPHQRVDERSSGLDDQPVGENRRSTGTDGCGALVTCSPVEPARRTLHEAPRFEYLECRRATIDRRERPQFIVRALTRSASTRGSSSVAWRRVRTTRHRKIAGGVRGRRQATANVMRPSSGTRPRARHRDTCRVAARRADRARVIRCSARCGELHR